MIRFSVAAVEKAPVTLAGSEPPEFLGLAPDDPIAITSPFRYHVTASSVSGGILLSGRCEVEISGVCGRCLAPVRRTVVKEPLELFFDAEELGPELDVSEDLRSELVLEFPMNLLCSDECRGLCPHCGADLNKGACACDRSKNSGDLRWGALDGLDLDK